MGGGSKGGGGHTPYEAPDSLKSAQKLRAIGLISLGPIKGTVNKWKTTYFDNTPIQNENGKDDNDADSFNFKNTEIQFTLGTQDQLPLKGFEASEREVPVNAEVKHAHPLTKTVIDPDVSRLRLTLAVSALFSQNDQGDTHGTSVTFEVLINNLPRNTYTIEGKSSSRFFRSYIIENLPEVPFTVTVKRVTEDSKSQRLQNATSWASYTEIIDTKLSYPNMALVGIKTDSRYNPNFPNINFLLHGRLVKIPSNYDPEARTYAAGIWKGDFKEDWTNNPAWVFYDLVTNKQIGLGERLGDFGVNKFQLYQIAQYCDQLVPDGYGGQEPRMTANLWITDQRSAYEVLSDMASVFRAMVIWNGQQMTATQDRPADPVCTYTQSNVIDGKFTRQYVAQKAIYTAVEVEYADKRNMYQKAIEYVADDDLIRRYGYNVKKITAFACTSRGQAHRYGKWILETSRLEQCTITFSVGREGLAHLPGDIIEVADNRYANTNLGGRVLSVNGKTVTLDRPIDFTADSYLGYLSTTGTAEIVRVKILSVDDKLRVNLDREPVGLVENANWTLHTAQVKTQLYRAIGIAENEDGSFAITALQHEPQKEAIVDNGAVFEPRNTTILNTPKIGNIQIDVGAGGVNIQGDISGGAGVVKYDIRIYKDGKLYDIQLGLNSPQIKLDNLPNGEYSVVIAVKNQDGQLLNEKLQTFTINRPPVPKNVRISGGLSDITLEWDWVDDVTATEIFTSETDDINTAQLVERIIGAYYSHEIGAKKVRYYWLRHKRGVNVGKFDQIQGRRGESGVDINAELEVLNKELSKNIIAEFFDTALPARKLGMTKYVNNLNVNTYQGQNQVYDETSNKMYIWNGTKYIPMETELIASKIKGIIQPSQLAPIPTANLAGKLTDAQIEQINATKLVGNISIAQIPSIPTNKLTGLLTDAQLQNISATKITGTLDISKVPAIPTTKLTGTIGANQISANAIGTNHLGANAVTAEKILSGAITSEKITSNAITADKIASNAITTDKLNANAVTAQKIAVNAIESNHIKAGSIIAGKLGANAVTADNIAANAITATKIMGGAITAEKLSVNSVGANAIQSGAITTDKLGANSVDAGKIRAGAISANHLQAGQISADKLAIGLGGNLLYNPIFANPTNGVPQGWAGSTNVPANQVGERQCVQDPYWGLLKGGYLPNENVVRWHNLRTGDSNTRSGISQNVPINGNSWYMISAYMGNHRCTNVQIYIDQRGRNGEYLGLDTKSCREGYAFNGLDRADRVFIKFHAHPNATSLDVHFFFYDANVNETNCYMFVARPMLEECTEYTTQPSAWVNAGVTAIHGGSIITRTITTEQLAANSVTANEIVAGAVNAKHVAAHSLNAAHIVTKSLTADLMNVSSLSAISANLGNITAGSININNRFKVNAQGVVEMRANAGNVGMVMTNEAIVVYDEKGVMRVKMGKLS